jgi:CRISPR-associated protein (TIGR03984 family)
MNWQERLIIGLGYDTEALAFEASADLRDWIEAHATPTSILLAHADDGVIWGYTQGGKLMTSDEADSRYSPPLLVKTLQDLRLFNQSAEIRLWRDINGWRAIRIFEIEQAQASAFDEQHLLWGTKATKKEQGFTLLEDGSQGLRHMPPSHVFARDGIILRDRIYLKLRHYLRPNASGVNSITMTRLVNLGQLNHGEK